MDTAAFRAAFPEFADSSIYTEESVSLWLTFATAQVNARRWGTQVNMGIYLYTAHEVTLAGQNLKTASIGGTPGNISGPVNSKTVGSVSVGYDTQAATEKDAGHWNLTSYGKQFIRLARIFGAGTVQL